MKCKGLSGLIRHRARNADHRMNWAVRPMRIRSEYGERQLREVIGKEVREVAEGNIGQRPGHPALRGP